MLIGPGPDLDRQIERKLNGDAKKKTPPYSTSEKAANRLLRRLEMQDMPCSVEEIDGTWYCTFWVVLPTGRERISTGSGETRALAIARAVMNARLGMGANLSAVVGGLSRRAHWAHGPLETSRCCDGCGVELATRNREAASRLCTVCSWRVRKGAAADPARRSEIPILPETAGQGDEEAGPPAAVGSHLATRD